MTETPDLQIRRKSYRQSTDPVVLEQILADGWIAHVALVRDGLPVVLPFLYAVGDLDDESGSQLLLHGSTGGRLFCDAGSSGVPVSVGVTHLDGLVLARSLNDSSANFRSAMIFGHAHAIPAELKRQALWIIGDHLLPGRRGEIRDMTAKELAATQVLCVALDHTSVKVRFDNVLGEAPNDGEDHSVWAGVIPVAVRAGEPVTSPGTDPTAVMSASVGIIRSRLDERAASQSEGLRRTSNSPPQPG